MNNRAIKIRADGSSAIGLGHLIRCLALAQMLKADFTISFYCLSIPDNIRDEIIKNGFGVNVIQRNDDLPVVQGDVVVLDGYNFLPSYQKTLKSYGAKLVCVDDLHDQQFFADLVINHAPGVSASDYKAQSYTKFALGPDFVLLRSAFLQQARSKRTTTEINNVIVCFGGSDSRNLTVKALDLLLSSSKFKKILVVTGAAYLHSETLTSMIDGEHVVHYHAVDEEQMLQLMCLADLAIVPASGTLLEALACGCTVISGKYIDNQELLFERYKKSGSFISAGSFDEKDLAAAISISAARSGSETRQSIFDGRSPERIRELFNAL